MSKLHRQSTGWVLLVLSVLSAEVWAEEIVSKTVALDGVTKIDLKGGAALHITQGDEEYVKVTAAKSVLPRIEASVKGNLLKLSTEQQFWQMFDFGNGIQFEVQLKAPEVISSTGSANISADELKLDHLTLRAVGSGSINLTTVEAQRIEIELTGSGSLLSGAMEADTLILKTSGTGDVEIGTTDTQRFDISMNGTGNLRAGATKSQQVKYSLSGTGDNDIDSVEADRIDIERTGTGDLRVGEIRSSNFALNVAGSSDARINRINSEQLSVEVQGSSNARFGAIESDRMTSKVSGSGSVEVTEEGQVNELVSRTSGSSDFVAKKLQCDNVQITASGASDVFVNVQEHLSAKTSGSASVHYYGNPAVESNTSGSSSISAIK